MPNDITSWYALLEGGSVRWTRRGRDPLDDGPPATFAPNVPQTVTAVKNPSNPTSQINVTWAAPAVDGTHSVQTGYRVYANGIQRGADLGSGVTSYTITGLASGATYQVTVRAFNASGASVASTVRNVLLDGGLVASAMLMGCSDSPNTHGGTEDWDGWRVYTKSAMMARANRTGTQRPKFLAYSKDGANLGGSNPNYTTVYNEVRADLDEFYYSSGDTRSSRWGISLYWSNGNENSDKGVLASQTTANIAAYVNSQRGLYDAVHYTVGGVRRYPDAYAGSNPTQNHEQNGIVEPWLHPSARYHDFVFWSMYPPGRQTTPTDPTFNWPSMLEADRYNLRTGFLARTFYRTLDAQTAARAATGDPGFSLMVACGEVGIGNDPDDGTTRPYYVVHALAGGMQKLATRTGLAMPFACYWDNQSDATAPQNILADEQGGLAVTTRMAWQNWRDYNHEFGGTHPASWAGNPKAGWKTTGPVV